MLIDPKPEPPCCEMFFRRSAAPKYDGDCVNKNGSRTVPVVNVSACLLLPRQTEIRASKYSFGGRGFEILRFLCTRELSGDACLSEGEQCIKRSADIAWKEQYFTGRSTGSDM